METHPVSNVILGSGWFQVGGLVQKICNSSALAMELHFFLHQPINVSIELQSNTIYFNIKTATDWLLFCGQHFQIPFLLCKLLYFDSYFSEICFLGSNKEYVIIDLDNALVQTGKKPLYEPMMAYNIHGFDEFSHWHFLVHFLKWRCLNFDILLLFHRINLMWQRLGN